MMSRQGMEVLADLFSEHSNAHIKDNPGCNQNDIERAFLYYVYSGMNEGSHYIPESLQEKIEKIR